MAVNDRATAWVENSVTMSHNNAHSPWTNETIDKWRSNAARGNATNGKPMDRSTTEGNDTKGKPKKGKRETPRNKASVAGSGQAAPVASAWGNPESNKSLFIRKRSDHKNVTTTSEQAATGRKKNNSRPRNNKQKSPTTTPNVNVPSDKEMSYIEEHNCQWPGGKVRTGWELEQFVPLEYDNDLTYESGFLNIGRNKETTKEQIWVRRCVREYKKNSFESYVFDMQIIPKEMHALPPTQTSYFVRFRIQPDGGESHERILEFARNSTTEIYDATPGRPRLHIKDLLKSLPHPDLSNWLSDKRIGMQADWLVYAKKPFRFLDLPLELRRRVYSHIFPHIIEPKPLDVKKHREPWKLDSLNRSLLRVSRTVYQEFSDHIFTSHTFRLDHPTFFRYLAGWQTEHKFDSRKAVLHKVKHLELAFTHDAFMLFFGVQVPDHRLEYMQKNEKAWGDLQAEFLPSLSFVDLTLTFDDPNLKYYPDRMATVDTILNHAIPYLRGKQVYVQGFILDEQKERFEAAINANCLSDFMPLDDTNEKPESTLYESAEDSWGGDNWYNADSIAAAATLEYVNDIHLVEDDLPMLAKSEDDPEGRAANEVMFGPVPTQDAWNDVGGWTNEDPNLVETWATSGDMDLDQVIW